MQHKNNCCKKTYIGYKEDSGIYEPFHNYKKKHNYKKYEENYNLILGILILFLMLLAVYFYNKYSKNT